MTVLPSRASRGSIVRIALDEPSTANIAGELGGEPLHFREVKSNQWHALGAVPLGFVGGGGVERVGGGGVAPDGVPGIVTGFLHTGQAAFLPAR